jgi:hypothetical protein
MASVYFKLGKHADALVMQERLLEFYHRVLPENHPDIGEGHLWSDVLHALFVL